MSRSSPGAGRRHGADWPQPLGRSRGMHPQPGPRPTSDRSDARHRELALAYQRGLATAPGGGFGAAAERAIAELLGLLDPLLRTLVWACADPRDDREELLQLARVAASRAAATWHPDGGASVPTWATTHARRALSPDKRGAMRLDRGQVQLAPLDALVGGGSPQHPEPRAVEVIVDHVRAACESLPAGLAARVVSAVQATARGEIDTVGSRAERAVDVRSALAHPAMGLRSMLSDASGWWDDAACRNTPLGRLFPARGERTDPEVVELCGGCPVREDCLAEAIALGLRVGYRGGASARVRRQHAARTPTMHSPVTLGGRPTTHGERHQRQPSARGRQRR